MQTLPPKWFAPTGKSPFRVKGVAYRGAHEYYEGHVRGGAKAMADAMDDRVLRDFFTQPFLASGWYDVLPFIEIDTVAARLNGVTLEQIVRDASRWQAQRELRGIYRVFAKLLATETIAKLIPRLAAQYYDFGTVQTKILETRTVSVSRGGIPRVLIPWLRVVSTEYLSVALEVAGATDVTVSLWQVDADGERDGFALVRATAMIRWS